MIGSHVRPAFSVFHAAADRAEIEDPAASNDAARAERSAAAIRTDRAPAQRVEQRRIDGLGARRRARPRKHHERRRREHGAERRDEPSHHGRAIRGAPCAASAFGYRSRRRSRVDSERSDIAELTRLEIEHANE